MCEDYSMTHQPFHHLPRTPADLKMVIFPKKKCFTNKVKLKCTVNLVGN